MELDLDAALKLVDRLIDDSGFTYPRPPTSGWMVGGAGMVIKKLLEAYGDSGVDLDIRKIRIARDIVTVAKTVKPLNYIGGWAESTPYDPNYGSTIYIEESSHFCTRDYAVIVAKQRGELAIYNLKEKRSIKLEDLI